jgi:hypothetical protein
VIHRIIKAVLLFLITAAMNLVLLFLITPIAMCDCLWNDILPFILFGLPIINAAWVTYFSKEKILNAVFLLCVSLAVTLAVQLILFAIFG